MTSSADSFGDLTLPQEELLGWLRRAADQHSIMAVTDAEGVILHVNDQFCEISGYAREELVGQTHRIIKSDHHPSEFFEDMWKTIRTGKCWKGTVCNQAKDGSPYWVSSTITPLPDAEGKPYLFMAMRTDVTPLKLAETHLHEQVDILQATQEQLKVFFDHAPIGISWREFREDGQPSVNHVNARFCEIIGLTAEQASDLNNVLAITNPEDRARQKILTQNLYSGKQNQFTMDKRYTRPDGEEVWCNLTIVVLRDSKGRVSHHFGMLADITQRTKAINTLKSREARWRTYLDTASEILYAITPEGDIKFASSSWTTKLGHSTEEALGHRYTDYVHPDDVDAWTAFFHETLKHGASPVSIEHRVRHADGEWIWHAMSASVYSDRNGRTAFLGVGRDITLRLEAQAQLRAALASREEMERIVNRSPSVVVLWRAEDNWPVEFVSQSVTQFGFPPEYFIDANKGCLLYTSPSPRDRG